MCLICKFSFSVEAVEANNMSSLTNNTDDNESHQTNLSEDHQVTIKERTTNIEKQGQSKMVVWNQQAGRVECGIVAGLTMLNSVVNSIKVQRYWTKNLDSFIMKADTSYARHRVEHVCHIIMAMTYLMNALIFASCLPVFHTISSSNFSACRQRRHGLLPFILIHIFTLVSSFNRMMLAILLSEASGISTTGGRITTEINVYILDISIDAIALLLMVSFYRNLRSYKVDSKEPMAPMMNNDIEASPTTKHSQRKIIVTGKAAIGYSQFNDSNDFVNGDNRNFEYVKS